MKFLPLTLSLVLVLPFLTACGHKNPESLVDSVYITREHGWFGGAYIVRMIDPLDHRDWFDSKHETEEAAKKRADDLRLFMITIQVRQMEMESSLPPEKSFQERAQDVLERYEKLMEKRNAQPQAEEL